MALLSISDMPSLCHSQRWGYDFCESNSSMVVFENLDAVSYLGIEQLNNFLTEIDPSVLRDLRRLKNLQNFPCRAIGYLA